MEKIENKNKYCSLKKHEKINAISYCEECKIYMCKKCENFHSELFEEHHLFNLDKNKQELFLDLCEEKHHSMKLEYYCKNHNQLCCAACLTKIEGKGNGKHKDCEVLFIEEIKEQKKNKLDENIKCLEEISKSLEQTLDELKKAFEIINEGKEKLKARIQKIFTRIRNVLNEREEDILIKVDEKFDYLYCNGDLIKEGEKLPNKIKLSLIKGKAINKEWKDKNKEISFINDCINIENNIRDIYLINEKLKNCNLSDKIKITFYPEEEEEINKFLEQIKFFGNLYYNNFKFKKCPINILETKKYEVGGKNDNIITKIGIDGSVGIICENQFENSMEYQWTIRILKSNCENILIGVAPIDFDIEASSYNTSGWYFYCKNSKLYSGPPHKYDGLDTGLGEVKNEVTVIMNMKKRTLKFIVNKEDKGDSYSDIPIDTPLTPAIFICDQYDSIEII